MDGTLLSPVEALSRTFELPQQSSTGNAKSQDLQQEIYHCLIIGNLGLMLASNKLVVEIFDSLPLCELPNTPLWVHAMANQRGNIIPIFDLAILLDQPKSYTKQAYYLVIGQNEDAFGVVLENLPEKIGFLPQDRLGNTPPIPSKLDAFVKQAYEKEGRVWLEWEPLDFIAAVTGCA